MDSKNIPLTGDVLTTALAKLPGKEVCIVGDVMLDRYVTGEVERISPEAPVPVVQVGSERTLLGGAGNVARNIIRLGGKVRLIGLCGQDVQADTLETLLDEESIHHSLVRTEGRMTTVKTRILAQRQQMLRIDHETPHDADGEDLEKTLEAVANHVAGHKVLILSDYGKGLVSEAFLAGLRKLLAGMPTPPLVLVDPKIRNFHLYQDVFLLTPNAKEAAEGAGTAVPRTENEILAVGKAIFKKLECNHLLITLGPQGMAYFENPNTMHRIPTVARKVFDVTGAGDTVMATIALSLAAGNDLLASCLLANHAAGLVVGEIGTAVVGIEEIAAAMSRHPDHGLEEIHTEA
jgi:D-glycero-beta-D-manno-heptose-7-phosphate kinase